MLLEHHRWVTAAKDMRDADHEMHEKGLKVGHELEIMSRNKADLDAFITERFYSRLLKFVGENSLLYCFFLCPTSTVRQRCLTM